MSPVAQGLSELFMMVLCVTAAPAEQEEIHVDLLADGRYMGALVAQREDSGFAIHKEMRDE